LLHGAGRTTFSVTPPPLPHVIACSGLIFGGLGSLLLATFLVLVWGEFPASSQEEEDAGILSWLERDAASTKYIYEEGPGTLLLMQQLLIGGVFVINIMQVGR
jgi:hypothetical protein